MAKARESHISRPLNVVTARGSHAETTFRKLAGLPGGIEAHPEAIAPGLRPTPEHNLVFHGGKTIQNLTFTNFYIGGAPAWTTSDIQTIDQALAAAMSDQDLNNVMMQYFKDRPLTSVFKPSLILAPPKPANFSQGDVEQLVTQLYTQGRLTAYDLGTTVFNFMLPSGTILSTDPATTGPTEIHAEAAARKHHPAHPEEEANSLQGLGGYHGSVHVTPKDTVYYAVGVYSEILPSGQQNGIVVFDQPWKNVVATFYHELNEARTDADVEDAVKAGNDPAAVKYLGWMSRQGEECGDYPIFEAEPNLDQVMKEVPLTNGTGTVPVQFQYSNAVQGPEGPIPEPHKLR